MTEYAREEDPVEQEYTGAAAASGKQPVGALPFTPKTSAKIISAVADEVQRRQPLETQSADTKRVQLAMTVRHVHLFDDHTDGVSEADRERKKREKRSIKHDVTQAKKARTAPPSVTASLAELADKLQSIEKAQSPPPAALPLLQLDTEKLGGLLGALQQSAVPNGWSDDFMLNTHDPRVVGAYDSIMGDGFGGSGYEPQPAFARPRLTSLMSAQLASAENAAELDGGSFGSARDRLNVPEYIYTSNWPKCKYVMLRTLYERDSESRRLAREHNRQHWSLINCTWRKMRDSMLLAANLGQPVDVDELTLADVVQEFVLNTDARKAFFEGGNSGYSEAFLADNPALYLLPNACLAKPSKWRQESRILMPRQLTSFETQRAELYANGGGAWFCSSTNKAWKCWLSGYNHFSACPVRAEFGMHFEFVQRVPGALSSQPNAVYLEPPEAPTYKNGNRNQLVYCECALATTVVLCAHPSHCHCRPETTTTTAARSWDPDEPAGNRFRTGANNRAIVACGVLGRETRSRWQTLCNMCTHLTPPDHGASLYEVFAKAVCTEPLLKPMLECLAEFANNSPGSSLFGKPHEYHHERRTQFGASIGPDADGRIMLDAEHHCRERFQADCPYATSLAILMFVETTNSSIWLNVWRFWESAVVHHTNVCPPCFNKMRQSLYRLVVYNAMLPMMSLGMARAVEKLADRLRYEPWGASS